MSEKMMWDYSGEEGSPLEVEPVDLGPELNAWLEDIYRREHLQVTNLTELALPVD